jgi:hypothetical protein
MWKCLWAAWVAVGLTGTAVGQPPAKPAPMWPQASHDFGTVPRGAQLLFRFPWHNTEKHRVELIDTRVSCGCATATANPHVLEPGQSGTIDVAVDGRRFLGPKTIFVQLLVSPGPLATTLQVSANSRADIVYNPGGIQFGVVAEGATPTQAVEIEYAGALDWHIEGLSQPPTHLDAKIDSMYRRPGQVGYRITITLHPDAPVGDLKQSVLLKTNDPANPVIPVLVEATIRAPVVVTPNPVHFGTARVGQTVTRKVTIRSDRPFSILKVDGADHGLTPAFATAPSNIHTLAIHWQPGEAGELHRVLQVHTDIGKHPKLAVTVEGQAQ